jgi:hypothetical protein
MRCSDCKFYRTAECTVNPNGDDCSSAEIFACFKSSMSEGVEESSLKTSLEKKKLPIKTKVAAWILLAMAIIIGILAIGISIAASCSANTDISNYAEIPLFIGFGIAFVFYFLPGILLLTTRSWGPWIFSVVILCIGIIVPTVFRVYEMNIMIIGGLPIFACLLASFLIPLILAITDKLTVRKDKQI